MTREVELIARDIMRYFLTSSANTADTLEGIARWRLLHERINRVVDETSAALRWLMARGFVEEVQTGAGPALFRMNAARRAEAQASFGARRKR